MRLAFVMTGGLHPSGEREVIPAWVALLDELARAHEVHAFTLRHLPEAATYRLHRVTVHDLGRPGANGPIGRWSEWRALRAALSSAGPFDVVHGVWVDPGGWLAAFAGRRSHTPSVVTCDSGEFSAIEDIRYGMQRTLGGRVLVRVACRLSTRVHVTTTYMQQLAVNCGYQSVKIPIGVDLRKFRAASSRADAPPWKLLQVASLNPVKDQTTLLDAVAIVARDLPVHLDLVGEDTLNGTVQRHARHLGIADRVTFHGFRTVDDLLPLYQTAHLYVQSSRHEAAAVAVLEAAACGLPAVGTRVGYLADWAPNGAAIAVETHDAQALAVAIGDTLRNPALRERLAANARAFVEAHDVAFTARELERLYGSLKSIM